MKGCMNMDQNKLLECMEEIKAIAQSQQNQMTKEEVHRYLSDMELKEEQFDAVYQYLVTNGITITGFHPFQTEDPVLSSTETLYPGEPEASTEADDSHPLENADAPRRISKAERNLELYRREVSALTAHSGAELSGTAISPAIPQQRTPLSTNSSTKYSALPKLMKSAALHWMR